MKSYIRLILPALLIGIILTGLMSAQMSWRQHENCYSYYNNQLPDEIEGIFCSGQEYGYPKRFVVVEPIVSVSDFPREDSSASALIGVSGVAKLDRLSLLINLAIWTGTGYVMLVLIRSVKQKKINKRTTKY